MTTTVFCELAGRAELSAVLAPEPLRTLVLHCHDIMRASIESHGGTVGPAVGDAMTAEFSGAPAPADDARRAAAAALHMLDALAATGSLTARIGAESGETGQSVAARLVRLAEPGTVLIGPAARGLLDPLPQPLRRDPYPEPYARPYAAAYAEPAAL